MELVEGPTLEERIEAGPIPVDEALGIARQIAEALEAAHDRGVIHRDLKPGNVKIRADGTVKVLDFGLAKAIETSGSGSGAGSSDLVTSTHPEAMTSVGMILGTPAYMSPEQARGKPVDRRADVWAFGAVLFEMLTGQRAFGGEDVTTTLTVVIHSEPEWSLLPKDLPAGLLSCLHKCLRKDTRQRIPDIGVMRLALDGAFETPTVLPPPGTRSIPRRWVVAVALAAIVVAVLPIAILERFRESAAPEMRLDVVTPSTTDPTSFALSPDGTKIVFVASEEGVPKLWLRELRTGVAQPLSGTAGAASPFWSPDSRSLAFYANASLKRLDLTSNVPQTLAFGQPRGGTWNEDGVILFQRLNGSPLFRISASGGKAEPVTTLNQQTSHRFPVFLPDGRRFIFVGQGTAETSGLFLGSLDSDQVFKLTTDSVSGVYLPSGFVVWASERRLVAQRLDLDRNALVGEPEPIADSVIVETNQTASAVSASATGLIAFRAGGRNLRQLAFFDRGGERLSLLGPEDGSELNRPSVSPDGQRVAVDRTVQGNGDIWLVDALRTVRLTFDAGLERFAIWSPDSKRVTFDSTRSGTRHIYERGADGDSRDSLLVQTDQTKLPNDWSSDGRFLLYISVDPQTGRDLWVLPSTDDRTPWIFLKTPFEERFSQFSPDGRWVTYMSNESGRDEIYLRPFVVPGSGSTGVANGQVQVSTAGGIHPRWAPDGRELYYLDPGGKMMAAPIMTESGVIRPGVPVALFSPPIYGGGTDRQQGRQYDVARDGRFLINTVVGDSVPPITLIQNWMPSSEPR
jgi:serine/threonine protein kinase